MNYIQSDIGSMQDKQPAENSINQSLFSQLNDSVTQQIIQKLSFSSVLAFAHVNKHSHRLFSLKEENIIKRDLLRQLLSHTALGELEQAKAIWSKHPELLTCRGTVFHPNRFYVEGEPFVDIPFMHNPGRYKYKNKSPLQILMINEEWDEIKAIQADKYLTPHEMNNQCLEVFPDAKLTCHRYDRNTGKRLLKSVFDALVRDNSINKNDFLQMNGETLRALTAFFHKTQVACHGRGLIQVITTEETT